MKRTTLFTVLFALASVASLPSSASASFDEKKDLQAKFEKRYPEILSHKSAGKIGETFDGFLAAVNDQSLDGDAKQLVDDENADRRSLYAIIAKEEGASASIVAKRAGRRNFDKARSGEFLKDKDGSWKRKA